MPAPPSGPGSNGGAAPPFRRFPGAERIRYAQRAIHGFRRRELRSIRPGGQTRGGRMTELAPLDPAVLPPGLRSRFVDGVNGLRMHVLETGEGEGRPLLLLLHGFPELAYPWRKVMPALAAAGFHVVAPEQRGYGRTTGWSGDYDGDLAPFRPLNLVRDALGLVRALGYRGTVAGVVGHDFGAMVAAWCALLRPDVFRSLALMSAPFVGPPRLPEEDPARR